MKRTVNARTLTLPVSETYDMIGCIIDIAGNNKMQDYQRAFQANPNGVMGTVDGGEERGA